MANLDPLQVLTPQERAEVTSLNNYLRGHASTDFQNMPEKTISGVLNKAAPKVREYMQANKRFVDDFEERGGKYQPFGDRAPPPVLDKPAQAILDRARTEEITHDLSTRMGTAPVEQPTTLRDIVDAAYDHHEGSTHD